MADRARPAARARWLLARMVLAVAGRLDRRSTGPVRRPAPSTGPRVTIGPDVRFVADIPSRPGPTLLGGDCWLGRGARVMEGVSIGPGAVVRPYSVVIDDVRPFAVVAGNPAVEVSRRFDDATVDRLLELAWWDWSDAEVAERLGDLRSADVQGVLDRLPES